ncbi:MAG: uracil-DNA glycosylase [Peptococcaceae bacterium]|nr:uracil-DNA glycosylase [Peptococcaceae bacterium]
MVHFMHNDWGDVLADEFAKPYYQELRQFLIDEYQHAHVFPPMEDIYNALHATSYADTKVVILGQDPYHGPGQAHGLSFSVRPGVTPPPSLRNIFKELSADVGCTPPNHGCLLGWAKQGVLLLNTTLTVRQGKPQSHAGHGWEIFTDAIISKLNDRQTPLVFILWGAHARSKKKLINTQHHHIIESAHPSPMAADRGFFGSRPFSAANAYLAADGLAPIDWCAL